MIDPPSVPQLPVNYLALFISAHSVGEYPDAPDTIVTDLDLINSLLVQTPIAATGHLFGLLIGELAEFQDYARHEQAGWLIDQGHAICDPREDRGALWVHDRARNSWQPVARNDPLVASCYEYRMPPGLLVALTKTCIRFPTSLTTETGYASTMGERVLRRDKQCWITRVFGPLVNCHAVPKRAGDAVGKRILEDFSRGTLTTPAVHLP